MSVKSKKAVTIAIVAIAIVGVGFYVYHRYKVKQEQKYPKFYSGNGRLEATEVYVAAKLSGRIDNIFVKEGDLVRKGEKLVQMQTNTLEAERDSTIAQIKVCEGELKMAEATVKQKQVALEGAEREYNRQRQLLSNNATSQQHFDNAETAYKSALANLEYAKANVISSRAQIDKQKAELKKTEADIDDSLLIAKYDGRVQNLLAHEGEVLSAGGRVMNIIALTDVYMTFFLPTNITGKVKLGAEVKLIFDAAPDFPINAKVTFIDPVAQFTPKSVETQVEREKLMFRIKASIDPERLLKHLELVKTGVPGVAWVKLAPDAKWEECPVKINLNAGLPPALEEMKQAAARQSAAKQPAEKQAAAKSAAGTKQPAEKQTAAKQSAAKQPAEKQAAAKSAAGTKQPAPKASNTPAELKK